LREAYFFFTKKVSKANHTSCGETSNAYPSLWYYGVGNYYSGGIRMYFVNRKLIEEMLVLMEELLSLYKEGSQWAEETTKSLALERIAHVLVEAIIDVGNSMIDGFIMRDPGSYEDILDIMEDERVITAEMAGPLKEVIGLRMMIVRDFLNIDVQKINTVLLDNLQELEQFPGKVRYYLENELGPVSAFSPEETK
jgi:uncharacterized protein YutE (UPF0331/DUF86 family)